MRTGRGASMIGGMTTNTITHPHVEAVQRLYGAYGRGDITAVLAEVDDDVDWAAEAASNSAPWYGSHRGQADVARFFEEIANSVDITEFELVSLTSNDTDVVAVVHWTYTVKTTGKSAAMYMQHWWRFVDGKIVFFRGSEDTEQSAAAFVGDLVPRGRRRQSVGGCVVGRAIVEWK
jgi:ketosteroid isomerase-like protein